MNERSIEFWVAIVASAAFVATRHKEKHWSARVIISAASGGIAYSSAADLSEKIGFMGITSAAIIITLTCYALFDLVTSILADKEKVIDLAKTMTGRK